MDQVLQRKLNPSMLPLVFFLSLFFHTTFALSQNTGSDLELFPGRNMGIFEFQFSTAGNFIQLSTSIKPGFGVLKDEDNSYVSFYQFSSGGEKKLIIKSGFRGRSSHHNPLYFESLFPIKIKINRFKKNSKITAEIRISYCDLKRGICYQEKRDLGLLQ